MAELNPKTHKTIERLCAEGDVLAEKGRYGDAIDRYGKAWDLLPEPRTDWEAATWILGAIGDASFHAGDLDHALDALESAMHCPDAVGNPFLHLRLGQVLLDKGDQKRAADELMRAWMGAGEDIFEEEDDRYLTFLRSRAKLD